MQIYRGISTRTKLASKQLLLFSTLTAAILLLATTTLLFLKPTQTAKAITPPDSCFAFDAAAGRIVDYGDVITNETEPNSANSRTIGSCATSLEIPSTIGGVAVVAIGDGAFQGNSITSVTIPDSVNMIAGSAFRSNQLATLTIPESVTYVGTHSFRGNRLTHIDILPASLSIAGSAFRDNQLDALPEYFTRPGVTSIPDGAFQGNIFTELVVPDNITSIGSYAFNSNKLTSVTLSNSMTSVGGNYTFAYNQITSLVLPEGLKSIGGSYTFLNNKISSLSFPQGFTSISATHAFAGNNISNLNLPDSLLSISNYAFYNNQLESISIPISTSTIGGFAFANNQISNAVIGNPSATMQHTSFVNNPISSMKLGDNTYNGPMPTSHPSCFAISGTNITDYYQASPIVARDSGVLCGLDVLVTDAATSIGDSAFSNNQLRSVVIPGTIISIGASVFTGNQIASLELGSSVVSIGNNAFSGNKLTSLDIPDSVESIGDASFSGNQISSLKLGNSLTSISSRTFANNQLISLTIPNSVTTIGDWAFSSNQLTTLTIPNSVTSIGNSAFSDNQLTALQLGNSLATIGNYVFAFNKLANVAIPDSVTDIHPGAFFGQNPGGGDMDRDKNSPYYIYSDDPAAVQYAYDSIWYVNLQTEDPSNPHNLQPGFISEWWWAWDRNKNSSQRDSLGGHLINPAKVTISHKNTSGSSLAPTSTYTGRHTDGNYIPSYATRDNSFFVPEWPGKPTPEEQAELDAGVAKYFFANQTITLTAPPIPGYLTPPPKTITLTPANNDIDFIYQPVVKSIDFTGTTPPPAISSSLISFSSLSIDNNDNGSCSSIKTSKLLDPLTPDAIYNPSISSGITILGGLEFSLICSEGATTTITYTLGDKLPTSNTLSDIRIYKHSPSIGTVTDITNLVSMTLDPTTNKPIISYELIDGSEWDEDGEVNGIIVDPIYVGVVDYAGGERLASTGNSIWIATILGTALMGVGVVQLYSRALTDFSTKN